MSRAVILTVLLASLIVVGTSSPAWAAQLDARINPNNDSSPFKMSYLKTVFLEYSNGGELFDALRDKEWVVSGTADSSDPGVVQLIKKLNQGIKADGSQARISDMTVTYNFHLNARNINTSIDYRVILEGTLTDYVITKDSQRTLVDLGWRGLSADGEIIVDGIDINLPLNILREKEPTAFAIIDTPEAEDVLKKPLINADFILAQPLTNWHFLFDPTGINVDAGTFGLDKEISGFVVSSWTMGESSLREGRQVERVFEAEINADQKYVVRSVQSSDQGNLYTIGFGALDVLDGVEIVGVTPKPPEGYATTSTGDFPIMIVYGMAGIAAIAGIAFFFVSSRSLKNEKVGQQGIDPSRLVGYQTSASSGGYQTNRGEAQLKDDTSYQKTRSVYENTAPQETVTPPPTDANREEAACGCAASAEMGSECDCAMQGSCLCDATCQCTADLCKEQAHSMS
ncbi:MAG: hypothetical protein K5790_01200 [Nitrosopumilus sp.]|uniref:hypothetical protein n=1 Tax=Nitrosopumilus sp. TaxID=2024843 RepID=UPI00247EF50D|nr:hypothetical protein [Nitrosopumilus sp.]MCV0391890.1 hypothetical protein [Nitrosopumilus sp.]